jgi:hypothetical protein
MSFTAEIVVRSGVLYTLSASQFFDAVGRAYRVRQELAASLPHSRLRLRIVYPNGTRAGRAELASAIRAVRVLAGEIPRRQAPASLAPAAQRPAQAGQGFTCLVTRKVSLTSENPKHG